MTRRRRRAATRLRVVTLVFVAGALGCVFVLLRLTGRLTESAVAGVIVVGVIGGTSWYLLLRARAGGGSRRLRVVEYAAIVLAGLVSAAPALAVILPGTPVIDRTVTARGDSISVRSGLDGRVRLLISLSDGAEAAGRARLRLTGTEPPVSLTIGHGHWHVGRVATSSVWVSARIPPGVGQLSVSELRRAPVGGVRVQIFRSRIRHAILLSITALVLGFAVILGSCLGRGRRQPIFLASMLTYGLYVRAVATPAVAIAPALVGILPSLAIGALAGTVAHAVIGGVRRVHRHSRTK